MSSGSDEQHAAFVEASLELLGLTIEPAWREPILASFGPVADAAAFVLAFPLPDEAETAPVFKA